LKAEVELSHCQIQKGKGIHKQKPYFKKNMARARQQWCMPVILLRQEAEIKKTVVQSQPETLSLKNPLQEKDWSSGSRCRP
jgi:hypothetical protein